MNRFSIVGCVWITAAKTESRCAQCSGCQCSGCQCSGCQCSGCQCSGFHVCIFLVLRPSSCSRGAGVLKVWHPFTMVHRQCSGFHVCIFLVLRPSSCSRGAGVLKVWHPFTFLGPKALREGGDYLELWKKVKITAPYCTLGCSYFESWTILTLKWRI